MFDILSKMDRTDRGESRFPAPFWRDEQIIPSFLYYSTLSYSYEIFLFRQFFFSWNWRANLTELKRLRGRLEVVRCSLESGIAIWGAHKAGPQWPIAEGALEGGLRGPTPWLLAAERGLFRLFGGVAAAVSTGVAVSFEVVFGNFILFFSSFFFH